MLIYLVRRGSLSGEFVGGSDVPVVVDITDIGMEDYESQLKQNSVSTARPTGAKSSNPDPRDVFVVHGRNEDLRMSMFSFLRALDLNPIEFSEAIKLTGKASPYVDEILDAAFKNAQAVVVLMSPDDEARLIADFRKEHDPQYEKDLTPQPRQNVLFEAGLAFGYQPNRTILVKVDELRPFSDIYGRHEVRLTNEPETRQELASRLKNAGCAVRTDRTDWLRTGDFTIQIRPKPQESAKKIGMPQAQQLALDCVKKQDPDAQNPKVDSTKQKDEKWIVEVSWSVQTPTVGGVQHVRVTISENGEVEGYEKTHFFGIA